VKSFGRSIALLGLCCGLIAFVFCVDTHHARPQAAAPIRLSDHDQWVADHGQADLVGFDYFDHLAYNFWHLPIPMHQGFAGWEHRDVECMTYIRPHVTVFFVMAAKPRSDDPLDYDWPFFGCSDARTGRVLSADRKVCGAKLGRIARH